MELVDAWTDQSKRRANSRASYGHEERVSGSVSLATGGYGAVAVHTMSYEFDVEGRGAGPFNKIVDGRMANKIAGDQIIVYYLTENPLKHTVTNETP